MDNISTEDQETIREFLVESHENLSRLDQDLVELEKHPQDANLREAFLELFTPSREHAASWHFQAWKRSPTRPRLY
jgi:chemotaxis protein histidine kinase CheA